MYDELDILREVGSIAASHGSIALSEMLGRKINLSMPTIDIVLCNSMQERIDLQKTGVAIISRLSTSIKGEAVFLLAEKDAFKLISLSCNIREDDKKSGIFTEIGISSIKEIGSIVTNAYLNAISMMLKKIILSLPPTLISGTMDEILNIIFSISGSRDYVVLIEAAFKDIQKEIEGSFYLMLTPKTAAEIRSVCKRMLRELEKNTKTKTAKSSRRDAKGAEKR